MKSLLAETAVKNPKLVESNLDSKPLTPIRNAVGVTKTSLSKVGHAGVTNAGANVNSTVGLGKSSKDLMTKGCPYPTKKHLTCRKSWEQSTMLKQNNGLRKCIWIE